jgi:hypothetical protein
MARAAARCLCAAPLALFAAHLGHADCIPVGMHGLDSDTRIVSASGFDSNELAEMLEYGY